MKAHLRTPVAGVGINDADYSVQGCPFYGRWSGMLKRCYSENALNRDPCYVGVEVCEEWKNSFMAFRQWMGQQDWEGNQLDKDLKGDGTIYSPDHCIFIPGWVNALFPTDNTNDLPLGVSVDKRCGKYRATISMYNQQKSLGYFETAEEAYSAYVHEKMYYIMDRSLPVDILSLVAKKFKKRHPGRYIYTAGSMRGLPEFNFPAFHEAADMLIKQGFIVFNPAKRDSRTGFDVTGMTGNEDLVSLGFCLRKALAVDTQWISLFGDGIYLLPGWERSTGAIAERALAEALGLQVLCGDSKKPFTTKIRDFVQKSLDKVSR